MFTGIVAAVGQIGAVHDAAGGVRLRVDTATLSLDDVEIGDSIAVDGVCLTVVTRGESSFEVDVSRETIGCVAGFEAGAAVNLEKALRLSDRLGGHLVSGHVDGVATIERVEAVGDNRVLAIALPEALARYVARKGSIAVNGVSLTINEVADSTVTANLIPHTLAGTNLAALDAGDRVNIEVDMLARYVERMLAPNR